MASDHQQQQPQQQQLQTQQPTQLTQPQQQQQQPQQQQQQPSHQLSQTSQSPSSQQQQQQHSQSQQGQSQQQSSLQQQQSHHRQQAPQHQQQSSASSTLPQQTELLSHSSTTLESSRHSGPGNNSSSSSSGTNATGGGGGGGGDLAPHNLSSSDQQQHQAQQQFCLRWNNFQSNIVNSFETLLDREELVDVTLTAEGRSLRAHRVLLSACSPYFRDLFQDVPPHQHPVIVLRDTRFLELKCLLCFIYHGEVNVSQDNLSCLLNLAENLKVKGLAQEGTKRHSSKEYEYGGRGVLSPDREGDLSDGGEPPNIPRPGRGGHLLRPGRSVSPAPPGVSVPFGNLSALGSLLGNPGLAPSNEGVGGRNQLDDHVRSSGRVDIRDSHHNSSGGSKGSSISLLNTSQFPQHERKDQHHMLHQQQHHHQQQQQQHHSPPSKRRKRHQSPLQHHSPSNTSSSSHHHLQQQQQQQGERFTNNSSGTQLTPPPLSLSTSHNNGGGGSNQTAHSNSSAHTPSTSANAVDDDGNAHAVNLSVCPSTSPTRLMVPKLELMTADDDTSNGEKERLERLEQRERICNFLGKEGIAGMISNVKFPGTFTDSDMEGEEEPPPPHDEENSADMEGHGPGGGLGHPLSHHLPPGLQQSFVPYPPTTHAAAAAAAAAAHHFANTFTPGPSGVPSSVSPASWRSHASDQNPNSPQGPESSCAEVDVLKHEVEDTPTQDPPAPPHQQLTASQRPAEDCNAGSSSSQLSTEIDSILKDETLAESIMEEHSAELNSDKSWQEQQMKDPLIDPEVSQNISNNKEKELMLVSPQTNPTTNGDETTNLERFHKVTNEFKAWQHSREGARLSESTASRHTVSVINLGRLNGWNIVDLFDENKIDEHLTKKFENRTISLLNVSFYIYALSWFAKFIRTSHFGQGEAMVSETEDTLIAIREKANAFIERSGRLLQFMRDVAKAEADTKDIELSLTMTSNDKDLCMFGTDYKMILKLKKELTHQKMSKKFIKEADFIAARDFFLLNICLANPKLAEAVHKLTVQDFTHL